MYLQQFRATSHKNSYANRPEIVPGGGVVVCRSRLTLAQASFDFGTEVSSLSLLSLAFFGRRSFRRPSAFVVAGTVAAGDAQTYSYMCVITQGSAFVQRTMMN